MGVFTVLLLILPLQLLRLLLYILRGNPIDDETTSNAAAYGDSSLVHILLQRLPACLTASCRWWYDKGGMGSRGEACRKFRV